MQRYSVLGLVCVLKLFIFLNFVVKIFVGFENSPYLCTRFTGMVIPNDANPIGAVLKQKNKKKFGKNLVVQKTCRNFAKISACNAGFARIEH